MTMRRLLTERLTAVAERTLIKGVESNHWHPIGNALTVDRLDSVIARMDRLVELAERLCVDAEAKRV
jgi:hypothetical protein